MSRRPALAAPSPVGDSAPAAQRDAALGGTGALELQRIRMELLSSIQEAKSVQESQLKDLDTRLSEAQRDLQPRVRDLETRHSISQAQLEQAQRKLQEVGGSDASKLRRRLDDLLSRFDRFAKIDVQSSIKPMSDDFRQSKAKLEELRISTVSSFKRLSDQVKAIGDNLKGTHAKLRSDQTKFVSDLDDLEPKICSVEQQIAQLRTLMHDTPVGSGSAELAKLLAKIGQMVNRIENEVLPAEIEKSAAQFEEAIREMRTASGAEIEGLSAGLEAICTSHQEMEQRRGQTEQSLATAMTKTFDIERNFATLSEGTRVRLRSLEQAITFKLSILKTRAADCSEERANRAAEFDGQVSGDIASLSQQIGRTVKALHHQVKSKSEENDEAQFENFEQIRGLNDQLHGPANIAGRVQATEAQVRELAAGVEDTMGRWVSPKVVAARLKRIEDRLLEYETKLNILDSKGIGKAAKFTPVVEVIPETPSVVESPKQAADK